MFRFLLLIYQQGHGKGVAKASFGIETIEQAAEVIGNPTNGISFRRAEIRSLGGAHLTIPDVRSLDDAELLTGLYNRHPALGERAVGRWNVRFKRELDMTNDRSAFIPVAALPSPGEDYLPVYEGRMVHQFDHAAKAYISGEARGAIWEPLPYSSKRIAPQFVVSKSLASRRGVRLTYRAGFCDVTGHANERTLLGALIPATAVCGNKVPTCEFDRDDLALPLIWLAIANSFVIDWIARRRVSITLNFFHLQSLPFPRIQPNTWPGRRLAGLVKSLSRFPATSEDPRMELRARQRRADARAEIDALVALAYGLRFRDLALILDDFKLLDRGQPSISDQTTDVSTVTRDTVLARYAKILAKSGSQSVDRQQLSPILQRLDLATKRGAVAYVPSELASQKPWQRVKSQPESSRTHKAMDLSPRLAF